MLIHVVRHAHAGVRSEWPGDDELRPLTERGAKQAAAIADALDGADVDVVWSSRFVRCRQTVQPLADRRGLEVVDHPHLAEGAYGTDALDALLAEAATGRTVLACSHGDVVPDIVRAAVGRGAELHGPAAPRKAERYEMVVEDGAVTQIRHVDRPRV